MNYDNIIYIVLDISLKYITSIFKDIILSILNFIIQTTSLIVENFNFAWLILIIFFILRDELTLLLLSITKLTYKDYTMDIDIKTSRKTMEYLNDKLEKRYGDVYNDTKLRVSGMVGYGAGDLQPNEILEDRGVISLCSEVLLKQAYERDGSVDTIISMYNIFINSCSSNTEVDQGRKIDFKKYKEDYSTEEEFLINNIVEIYRQTLFNKDIKDLWRFEDILMYRKMILMAVKIRHENSDDN